MERRHQLLDMTPGEPLPTSMIAGSQVELAAITFRLLANPNRLHLVRLLSTKPLNVGQLADLSGFSQPNVSQHLARLRRAGLVESQRQGHHVTSYLTTPLLTALCALACQLTDEIDRTHVGLGTEGSHGLPTHSIREAKE